MCKVSIIIPVYNAENFLRNCIESVVAQTNVDWEAILVNDGSKDGSFAICEELAEKDKRIKVINKPNGGPSSARNIGVREAQGEYVFFLDADDTITPDCIESLYGLAKQHDADYVQGKYTTSPHPSPIGRESKIPRFLDNKKEIKRLLLNHNKIQFTPHNRLVRRQMIIDNGLFFNEEIKVREDFLWMTFVAKYVKKFASCDKPTYNRGYNEDSLTNNINKEREIAGYRVLIETMVANYDRFQLGYQKELALEALMMALRARYYHDEAERQHLIEVVMSKNNCIENILLALYMRTKNTRILHLLVRLYKV